MKLLLDTSIIIDFLRQKEKSDTLLYKLSQQDLYISIITHTELYSGKSVWEKETARAELEKLFSGLTILQIDVPISKVAGKIRAQNQNTSLLDCIIAATAIQHKLNIVTLNNRDFEKIDRLKLFESK